MTPLALLKRRRADLAAILPELRDQPEAYAQARRDFDAVQSEILALVARKGARR